MNSKQNSKGKRKKDTLYCTSIRE